MQPGPDATPGQALPPYSPGTAAAHEGRPRPRPRPRRILAPELAATLLACATVPLSAIAHVPTWGIFLGWATATLSAGNRETSPRSLVRGLVAGALFGVLALWLHEALGTLLGGALPVWVPGLTVLAGLNPLLILLGRIKGFASVPGMFIAFATVFAAHATGDLPLQDSIALTGAAGMAMNLLGVLFHQAYLRMTSAPGETAPDR